jgi:hypothetical protein
MTGSEIQLIVLGWLAALVGYTALRALARSGRSVPRRGRGRGQGRGR